MNFFKPRNANHTDFEPSAPPPKTFCSLTNETWCVGGKLFCEIVNQQVSEPECIKKS